MSKESHALLCIWLESFLKNLKILRIGEDIGKRKSQSSGMSKNLYFIFGEKLGNILNIRCASSVTQTPI